MRESIGASFILNFIIFFILLVFAFLMGTFSYYKAYKVNNMMMQAIEKYEGYNNLSIKVINESIGSFGYETAGNPGCPNRTVNNGSRTINGNLQNNSSDGYCIYYFENDTSHGSEADRYDSFGVLTYMRLKFPVVQYLIRIPVYSKTYRMYYFG